MEAVQMIRSSKTKKIEKNQKKAFLGTKKMKSA